MVDVNGISSPLFSSIIIVIVTTATKKPETQSQYSNTVQVFNPTTANLNVESLRVRESERRENIKK